MVTTFKTKPANLPIIGLAIIFSLSALLITSCGDGNSSSSATKVDSTKASFKILGTWVSADDPLNKAVFTTDSITTIEGGKASVTAPYKWVSEQEIEITTDKKQKAQIAIDGDNLTMTVDSTSHKLIREGANTAASTAAPANTVSSNTPTNTDTATNTETATNAQVPLTQEAKVFKNNLVGKWTDGNEILTITENKIETSKAPGKTHTYHVADEKTVEATQDWNGTPWKATMKIEDNGNTLLWYNETQRKNFKYTRVNAN